MKASNLASTAPTLSRSRKFPRLLRSSTNRDIPLAGFAPASSPVSPLTDLNDLLKSLVVEDGGKLAAVSYDGVEPAVQSLNSFAVDLTTNPTFGPILNQSRGERVEIVQSGTRAKS